MRIRSGFIRSAGILACALLGASSCRESLGPTEPLVPVTIAADSSALRVLMVGNSLTFYNDLPTRTADIAWRDSTLRHPDIHSVTAPGATLGDAWTTGQAQQLIQGSHWDYIVLQEQSSAIVNVPDTTEAVVRRFNVLAKAAGARTVLFLIWAPLNTQLQDSVTRTFQGIASRVGTLIAPLGVAWQRALQEDSTLPLYADAVHPTPMGTYLGACTMFATLYRHSPVGLAGTVALGDSVMTLDSATAALLQNTAWQVTQPYLPH